jgi:RNA ligase
MNYQFPSITSIEEVRQACLDANARVQTPCFVERNTGHGYIVFDYVVNVRGLFQDLTGDETIDRASKLVRECRGLIFDEKTGQVIARGYHKFFNVNERPEVLDYNIDMTQDFIVLEKLDGSMLRPVRPLDKRGPNDPIRWGTMMGWTPIADLVNDFVNTSSRGYKKLVIDCENNDVTPIFEWCSRKQPIVIDYENDALILTGMRHNVNGEYIPYSEMQAYGVLYDIPVVKAFEKSTRDLKSFINYVRGVKNMEGYIIRFATGHMTKLKADDYCFRHNAFELLQSEKDIVQLVVEGKVDDHLPTMDAVNGGALTTFEADFHKNIAAYAQNIVDKVEALRAQYPSRKEFYLNVVKNPDFGISSQDAGYYARAYAGQDVQESVMHHIRLHMHSGPRIDEVRHYWGNVSWHDYRSNAIQNAGTKYKAKAWWAKLVDKVRLFFVK